MWLGHLWWMITIGAAAAIIQWEMRMLLRQADIPPNYFPTVLIGLWVSFNSLIPMAMPLLLFFAIIYISWESTRKQLSHFKRIVSTMFCGIYAPLLFHSMVVIREIGTVRQGFTLALFVLFLVWGNDVFAYAGGRLFGKTKLAPSVSPGKTWEGFATGFLGSLAGLGLIMIIPGLDFPLSFTLALPCIILAGIFGPVGDLFESRMKRVAGAKDSGHILPGHGGLFDRFDALLLAAPAVLVYLNVLQEFGILPK